LDLGCGTGRLALGAAFLGAKEVVGVDIDRTAIKTAAENSANTRLKGKVQWVTADIDAVCGQFDTVLQNPPFGVQKRGADRKFLEKALESGKTVYSLHKAAKSSDTLARKPKIHRDAALRFSSSPFLRRFIENHGGTVKAVYPIVMTIPHMFEFHTRPRHDFTVHLYVIEKMKRHDV
jgi:putative methylase